MNLERFHSILATATRDTNDSEVPTCLQELTSHLANQSNDPANADHQRSVSQSRSELLEALTKAPSNDYPPSWENVLRDYGLTYFVAKNVTVAVDEAFRGNDITPQAVLDALQSVQGELGVSLQHSDQILRVFDELGVKTDDLLPGDVEIAYTVPRELYEESPSKLGKEFREIESLLKPFAEMATGQAQEFKVRSISSSDFMIVLGVSGVSILGAAKVVRLIAAALRDIISAYKDVVEIRLMKSKLGNIDGIQEQRDIATGALEDLVQATIDAGLVEAAAGLSDTFNEIEDKGRANEVRNHVQANMKKIAARIDHGYDIETRMGELPAAATEEEEGEGEEASVEDPETKALRDALETISEAHREQLTFERGGEPILSLPDPSDDELPTA